MSDRSWIDFALNMEYSYQISFSFFLRLYIEQYRNSFFVLIMRTCFKFWISPIQTNYDRHNAGFLVKTIKQPKQNFRLLDTISTIKFFTESRRQNLSRSRLLRQSLCEIHACNSRVDTSRGIYSLNEFNYARCHRVHNRQFSRLLSGTLD